MPDQDLNRLKAEYSRRKQSDFDLNRYSFFNRAYMFMIQSRERNLLQMLMQLGLNSLQELTILEVGSGRGRVLLDFLSYGVKQENLIGIDLLLDRLQDAKSLLPHAGLTCADGQKLPYQKSFFDVVLQFTAFSSILDPGIKNYMAQEMLRVTKPKGIILWYDFYWNPTNKQTKGIKPAEIRTLFPGCTFVFRRITLAPPIARKLVPVSWQLAQFLESLRVMNSHYLVLINKLRK